MQITRPDNPRPVHSSDFDRIAVFPKLINPSKTLAPIPDSK